MKNGLQQFETFSEEEEYIRNTWIALTTHMDRPRALWYAYNAKQFLDNRKFSTDKREWLEQKYKQALGYQIVAVAYIWNDWFEEAFEIDQYFIQKMYWKACSGSIEQYIEMLIIKRQKEHLEKIFDNVTFRYAFLNHYELFYSLLIDKNYRYTYMNEFVSLLNKVNGLSKTYGDGKIL